MYEGILTSRESEDPSALPHRRATVHLSVCRLHQSLLEQLRSSKASANALRHGRASFLTFDFIGLSLTSHFSFTHLSDRMHVNFPAAKSATPIHHHSASTSRITTSKVDESRTRKRRAIKCHRRSSGGAFPNRQQWAQHHVSQPHHQLRSRLSLPQPSTLTMFSTSPRPTIVRKFPRTPWTLMKCPTASRH